MPIQIVRNDITKMRVDAIVNAANKYLRDGSGVNGAIHKAAGPRLLEECSRLNGCKTGEAKITAAYDLPAKYVIHTVGPVWHGGTYGEKELLTSCYQESLELAAERKCYSIAFPLISSGVFGFPKEQALRVAMEAISTFLLNNEAESDITVYIVVFGKDSFQISRKLFVGIEQYIDDHYVDDHTDYRREQLRSERIRKSWDSDIITESRNIPRASKMMPMDKATPKTPSLDDALNQIDESFSQMILRKIKERGMKNSECYKKANIDKKLFSKINNDIHYKPRKTTALALAVSLELSIEETKDLLMKAGLALSHSEKFDIIVEYFITNGQYDIFEINEVLFYYDQVLLGGTIL